MNITPNPIRRVVAHLDPVGRGTVSIDDRDVSGDIRGIEISSAVNEVSHVVLHLKAGHETQFEGYAQVSVGVLEPGPAAAQFLAAIDPRALEQAALNRPDLSSGPHGLTEAMLATLIDWAEGRS